MKLALLLFGISKDDSYNHWHNKKYKIDYKKSYDNYKKFIFDYFQNKGYDIDIYFTTNILDDANKEELYQTYKPKKCDFIMNDNNKHISKNKKLQNVIELCLNENEIYDLVLITRFDLLFRKDFNESNILLEKFNIVSILEKEHLICDNFYLFPYSYLEKFLNVIKKNIDKSLHLIKNDIENINGKDFINYILNENSTIGRLSFYTIVRTNV